MPTPQDSSLTPLRAHYLKKSLIQLQFHHELDALTSTSPTTSPLSYLGPPFSPAPKDAPPLDLPFCRWIFRQFVLTFPFMAAAPKDFYADKLQPFVSSVLARNFFSPSGDSRNPYPSVLDDDAAGEEQATRTRLLARLERSFAMFVAGATKIAEREEVVRLSQGDLDRLEESVQRRRQRVSRVFEVNVVGVRSVVDKGRVRSRAHDEFIIRTHRTGFKDVFVSRRYGDFKTLYNELRKAHPDEDIRPPPAKDRTTVTAATPAVSSPLASPAHTINHAYSSPPASASQDSFQSRQSPLLSPSSQPGYSMTPSPSASSFASSPSPIPRSRLAREKNRLTLRAYLHTLLSSRVLASSPVLKSFLLSGPTSLTRAELDDARRREEADQVREEGRKRFAKEVAARVEGLREAVRSVKGDLMGQNGLTHIFATIKDTPHVRDLPDEYRAVLEWARISLASTVFQHFVAADNASETFANLKRIHGLMPYILLRGALKISNPIGMIRSVLDLFLAQPFGGKSLLQRMFTSSLTEEAKALEEQIDAVKDKIDDPVLCEKIRQFVYAPKEIQDLYKSDASAERMNVVALILRSGEEPVLSRAQMYRVARAQKAHAAYERYREALGDSDDDDGPQDEDAWLFEDLRVLAHLYSRLRDREQWIGLIFEGFTAELLKDIITIFYSPLAQVYKAASIADSLSDLQNFVNDLIRTVDGADEFSQEDPQRTVQTFIDLIQRHEQSFYSFVHKVHSKGEGLFDSLMRWIELFLTVLREGIGQPISLECLLPHMGKELEDILDEIDKVALYHYKLKLIHEDKVRRRFVRVQRGGEQDGVDAEDQATQALVDGIVGGMSFGELMRADADDLASEESSEYETDSEESGTSGSEESSEEDAPRGPPRRAQTMSMMGSSTPPTPQSGARSPVQARPAMGVPRKRSMSLKLSRSMTSLKESTKMLRRSHDSPGVPPVPPLPRSADGLPAALAKPLPPSPSLSELSSSSSPTPRTPRVPPSLGLRAPRMVSGSPAPRPKRTKARNATETLKPPELKHIPQLLPVFVEMMRPNLRPRQRTAQS